MNRQYNLVNECLNLLRDRDIALAQKLRIDVQLIQLKGLLLVREMDEDTADCFMVSLLAICRKISKLDGGEGASVAFTEVTSELQRIIETLTRDIKGEGE